MRKLILTSLATVMVAGVSSMAIAADACDFNKPVGNLGFNASQLAEKLSDIKYANKYKPGDPAPAICQQADSMLQLVPSGSFAVSTISKGLQSIYCTNETTTPLSQQDTNLLSQYSGQLAQLIDDCTSMNYTYKAYKSSGASDAHGYNPTNPNSYSSNAVNDTAPHQPQPNIQWNTAPKQKSSQSITTDQPDKGNVPTVNSPTPFNVTPKNNNNGGSNESIKNSNSSSRFF